MSIRPTYRKRSVVQVLADGMSAHPPKSGTHINVTADAASTPADFSEKLRKLSEEFKKNAQIRALRDAEGNVVEHLLTPRKFAAGGYVPSPEGGGESCCEEAVSMTEKKWTRADLPSETELRDIYKGAPWGHNAFGLILKAIVAHLNERGGVPDETRAKLSVEGAREARERMSRVYPGWGHAPVTVPPVPTYGKCCEEAQLTAAELARRNEELSEAEEEIAALKDQVCDWKSGADAEAWAHDEARDKITGLVNEIARIQGDSKAEIKALARRAEKAEAERDELQAKLDDAENRLTLDRDEVIDALNNTLPHPDDIRVTEQKNGLVFVGTTAYGGAAWILDEYRAKANELIREAAEVIAVVRFIERRESEQAVNGDEEQRVENLARELHSVMSGTSRNYLSYDEMAEAEREAVRAVIRAGWTPPESEGGNE